MTRRVFMVTFVYDSWKWLFISSCFFLQGASAIRNLSACDYGLYTVTTEPCLLVLIIPSVRTMSALTSLFRYVLLFAVSSEFLAVILAFMAFYVYKYRSHAIGSRRRPDLKQPKGVFPILGHLPLLASVPSSDLYQFFEKQHNELGPVWSITLPIFGRIIQIDSAENVEHVLKTNSYNFEKGGAFKGILEDLLGTEGTYH